jgi:formylglycine-generating enzyme required for sulfatase activity
VVRGGSWNSSARLVRAAYRYFARPSDRWYTLGFRLARGQE